MHCPDEINLISLKDNTISKLYSNGENQVIGKTQTNEFCMGRECIIIDNC